MIARLQGLREKAIVVGMNEQAMALACRMSERPTNLHMAGFYDDRPTENLRSQFSFPLLGKLQELPQFVNENQIEVIYISLPMVRQPRIQALRDGLRDTTSSIDFVPDLFVTDLLQG